MTDHENAGKSVIDKNAELAQLATERYFEHNPELEIKYGNLAKAKSIQDTTYHLQYLGESVRNDSPEIFEAYMDWAYSMLESRNVATADLLENLKWIENACQQLLPDADFKLVDDIILKGIQRVKNRAGKTSSFLVDKNPLLDAAKAYLAHLLKGERKQAQEIVSALWRSGHPVSDIYEYVFKTTQYEVGLLWQTNKITVAHEHYCTAATQVIMASFYPAIFESKKKGLTMMACAVSGDLHELGIRMVSDCFELDGWDTYYMGSNMPEVNIISSLKEQKPHLLAISVTIPFHLSKAEGLIKEIRLNKELDALKIIVGGYTFNIAPTLWKKMGADGAATNAMEAIEMANDLVKNN